MWKSSKRIIKILESMCECLKNEEPVTSNESIIKDSL